MALTQLEGKVDFPAAKTLRITGWFKFYSLCDKQNSSVYLRGGKLPQLSPSRKKIKPACILFDIPPIKTLSETMI